MKCGTVLYNLDLNLPDDPSEIDTWASPIASEWFDTYVVVAPGLCVCSPEAENAGCQRDRDRRVTHVFKIDARLQVGTSRRSALEAEVLALKKLAVCFQATIRWAEAELKIMEGGVGKKLPP